MKLLILLILVVNLGATTAQHWNAKEVVFDFMHELLRRCRRTDWLAVLEMIAEGNNPMIDADALIGRLNGYKYITLYSAEFLDPFHLTISSRLVVFKRNGRLVVPIRLVIAYDYNMATFRATKIDVDDPVQQKFQRKKLLPPMVMG